MSAKGGPHAVVGAHFVWFSYVFLGTHVTGAEARLPGGGGTRDRSGSVCGGENTSRSQNLHDNRPQQPQSDFGSCAQTGHWLEDMRSQNMCRQWDGSTKILLHTRTNRDARSRIVQSWLERLRALSSSIKALW